MSGEHTSLPIDPLGGQVPEPEGGQTATPPAPADAASQEPVEDLLDLRVESEQYQIPRTTVQDLAARFGRREEDIVRVLQTGLDHSRIYGDLRLRERELARREAELQARDREVRAPAAQVPVARPKVEEDPVAFWNWTADRLTKLDAIDALSERIVQMEEHAREAQEDDILAEQYWSIHEQMMQQKEEQQLPVVDGRTLARVIDYYGLADRPGMSMEDKMEAAYRIAAFGVPSRVTARPAPRSAAAPPPSPIRSVPPPRVGIPRASSGPPAAPGEGPPGETLEQRRERLFRHPVANMSYAQLHQLEQAGE